MKKLILLFVIFFTAGTLQAQQVNFDEYDLENGLHVILHQDRSAPVVTVSMMYHVGAKNENPERTGFAHFFEHLLFEGSENIERGTWFNLVSSNQGYTNANTTDDRTYFYQNLLSNNLDLGLWLESERMLHPVINEIGVQTQNEVVKEEKRMRIDNAPYGQILAEVKKNLYKEHPYRWTTIGSMEHLDAATLEEFKNFKRKFIHPNNATLVVAGDIDLKNTKKKIEAYFAEIPKGPSIDRPNVKEQPISQELKAIYHDPNIQIPALVTAFRTPGLKERDAYVLDMISGVLSDGKSSRLYKKLVEDQKQAIEVGAINLGQEDYGNYFFIALPLGNVSLATLQEEIDEEILRLQTEQISSEEYQALKNKMKNRFVNSNNSIEGIAHSLATFHVLHGDTNLINNQMDIYNSITPDDIQRVAKEYLKKDARLVLEYLPSQNQ